MFGEALDRLAVAKDVRGQGALLRQGAGRSLAAPGPRRRPSPSASRATRRASRLLLAALKPLAALNQERYPVHQAVLFGLVRLADKTCKACEDKLTEQIERDEKAVRLPGARGLLAETRVALAIIQNTEPGAASARAKAAAAAAADATPAPAKGKDGKASVKASKGKKAARKGKKG